MDDNKKPLDMRYVVFGPDLNANSDFVVGPNGIARRGTPDSGWIVYGNRLVRRGTPQAESLLKSRATTPRPVAHSTTLKSKLQAIKPITEKETASAALESDRLSDVECNHMKTAPTNSSFADLIKDPSFRWTLLYILLAVLIYCLWPRGEYVSMGNSLILNKRTGEVHRACDRIKK